MKPAREPASSRPKPCASLKKPHESCPFAAPCGLRGKKNDRGQRSAFPSETSRFALSILAHRGMARSTKIIKEQRPPGSLPGMVGDSFASRRNAIEGCQRALHHVVRVLVEYELSDSSLLGKLFHEFRLHVSYFS